MKGITPVIAIILLLLMAVAAAGGFYFVYQSFSQTGQESGSSQIDKLNEDTLSSIKIESIASGKIYVRNTGSSDIDTSKLIVYIDNVPYTVNSSSDTLSKNSRVSLKLTEVPSCAGSTCDVKLSGVSSYSEKVAPAKLRCASSSDCTPLEMCVDGVCYDDTFGLGNIISLPVSIERSGTNFTERDTQSFTWNGEGFDASTMIAETDGEMLTDCMTCFSSDDNALQLCATGDYDLNYSVWNGTGWSYALPLSDFDGDGVTVGPGSVACDANEAYQLGWTQAPAGFNDHSRTASFSSSAFGEFYNLTAPTLSSVSQNDTTSLALSKIPGQTIAVWQSLLKDSDGSENHTIMYSLGTGDTWSPPLNVSESDFDWLNATPKTTIVAFDDDGTGFAFWISYWPDDTSAAQTATFRYSLWDGDSWSQAENITTYDVSFQGLVVPYRIPNYAAYVKGVPVVMFSTIMSMSPYDTFNGYELLPHIGEYIYYDETNGWSDLINATDGYTAIFAESASGFNVLGGDNIYSAENNYVVVFPYKAGNDLEYRPLAFSDVDVGFQDMGVIATVTQ